MNLGQLRSTLRDLLNEPELPSFWTDTQLNSYLSLGALRVNSIIIAMRQEWFTVSATFNTIVGTISYQFPPDLIEIRRMELLQDPSNLSSIVKIDELKWPRSEAGGDWLFTSPGQPVRYIVRSQQFDLWPVPDSVYKIRLYYTQRPLDIATDTATPTTPIEFHDMIIFYAGILAQKQNETDDEGFALLFKERKAELIEVFTRRGGEDSKAVEAYLEGVI